MTSVSAQNVTVTPERAGPSQNCLPATCRFPLGGTTRSNSTAPGTTDVGNGGTGTGGDTTAWSTGWVSRVGSFTGTSCCAVRAGVNRSAGNAMSSD